MSTVILGLTATAEIEVVHDFVSEELELERQEALDRLEVLSNPVSISVEE